MKKSSIVLKAGTRSSTLALIQSDQNRKRLENLFQFLTIDLVKFESPGDRDKIAELQTSSPDFFTKDLDNAVLENNIDCAIHSAKDLPYPVKQGLDWFWLPWMEDPRDVIIVRKGYDTNSPVIGVSSERRERYSVKRWPNAILKSIRGNIEERIKQLDDGLYDILIMAGAAINRLNLQHRILESIPPEEITPPEGQGFIALTFKENNPLFQNIRKYFSHSVVFAGAGPGSPDLASIGTLTALKNCDICLYDALLPIELLKFLPKSAKKVFVGKRNDKHSIKQPEITQLIVNLARQGKKVVRLKGGDPGIFGRLTEETDMLNMLNLPYRVIPGISSINAAATTTGLLLTRRNISRGFSVATCRQKNSKSFIPINTEELNEFTKVFLMSISFISELTEYLISTGIEKHTHISVIFNAGCVEQNIMCSTLSNIEKKLKNIDTSDPGLIIIGKNADKKYLFRHNGALSGHKILLTCSENITEKAATRVIDLGGIPICKPMISLNANSKVGSVLKKTIHKYDWIIITSPGSVRYFMEIISNESIDIRNIPKIMVCGTGTFEEFKKYNIIADAVAKNNYGSKGILDIIDEYFTKHSKILRLKSNLASTEITDTLSTNGYEINEMELYKNDEIKYYSVPLFDYVVFASSSAINTFINNFGSDKLANKTIVVFGKPTEKTLKSYNIKCTLIVNTSSTITGCIDLLALYNVKNMILS